MVADLNPLAEARRVVVKIGSAQLLHELDQARHEALQGRTVKSLVELPNTQGSAEDPNAPSMPQSPPG